MKPRLNSAARPAIAPATTATIAASAACPNDGLNSGEEAVAQVGHFAPTGVWTRHLGHIKVPHVAHRRLVATFGCRGQVVMGSCSFMGNTLISVQQYISGVGQGSS